MCSSAAHLFLNVTDKISMNNTGKKYKTLLIKYC